MVEKVEWQKELILEMDFITSIQIIVLDAKEKEKWLARSVTYVPLKKLFKEYKSLI